MKKLNRKETELLLLELVTQTPKGGLKAAYHKDTGGLRSFYDKDGHWIGQLSVAACKMLEEHKSHKGGKAKGRG